MTGRKDIDQLLKRFVDTPGCVVDRCASSEGHHFAYRVDDTGKRITRKVPVPSTPSAYGQLNATRQKFRAYLDWHDPKVQRGGFQRRKRRAKAPQTTKEPPTMAAQTASGAEKLVRRILNDSSAPQLLRLAVIEAAQRPAPGTGEPQGTPRSFRDRPGVQWRGDVFDVIRNLWDDLPRARNNAQVRELATGLLGSLKDSGEMHLLNSDASDPLWWVAVQEGEWSEPDTPGQGSGEDSGEGNGSIGTDHTANEEHAAAADTPAAPASPASPPSPEPDRESPASMRLVKCDRPGCAYVDTPAALATHKARLGTKTHPDGVYPCPDCPVVRTTLVSYKTHMRKAHGYRGECCSICLSYFSDRSNVLSHACPGPPSRIRHAGEDRLRSTGEPQPDQPSARPGAALAKAAPERSPAPDQAVTGTVAAAPLNGHTVDGLDPVAVARSASEMLARHADVLQESAGKDARIIELSTENAELRRQLNSTKRKLGSLLKALNED